MFDSLHITARHRTRPPPPVRLRLEPLEDRTVPSSVGGLVQDPALTGLAGWRVWLDNNNNSILDIGERSATTDGSGHYSIDTTGLTPAGTNSNNGLAYDRVRLDLAVGNGGRWLNTTALSVNLYRGDPAVHDFGVEFQPTIGVAPVGGQSLVNVTTAGQQGTTALGSATDRNLSVAANSLGNYVVAWRTYSADGLTDTISARVFNANGSPHTDEILIRGGAVTEPRVAMAGNGQFTVTWSENGSVLARAYRADGTALGGTLTVYTPPRSKNGSTTFGYYPHVAVDAAGNGVIAYFVSTIDPKWGGGPGAPTLRAQRFTAAGTVSGNAFTVATPNLLNGLAAIAMDRTGNFVVTWNDVATWNYVSCVYAQRYDASGHRVGSQITVAGAPGREALWPSVAMNATGRFVVTYSLRSQNPTERLAQVYNSNGTPAGPAVSFAGTGAFFDGEPAAVAIDAAGNVTFAWTSDGEVRMRRLTATGVLEPVTITNTTTQGTQALPGLAATGNGSFVVGWQGYGPEDTDGGIFAQLYAPLA